jgi:hypothetical protein
MYTNSNRVFVTFGTYALALAYIALCVYVLLLFGKCIADPFGRLLFPKLHEPVLVWISSYSLFVWLFVLLSMRFRNLVFCLRAPVRVDC